MTKAEVGARGERVAERYLRQKKFVVLKRNWKHGKDEIDLVCMDGEILVFIEVKTRNANATITGYHSVNARKKRALLRACKAYLRKHPTLSQHYRFDVVEVRWEKTEQTNCLHYENVALFRDH